MYTVRVRLAERSHEAHGIDQRLRALGQLQNATIRQARRRADKMMNDSRWAGNMRIKDPRERTAAYQQLRKNYQVSEFETREIACQHWNASGWMPDLLDRRAANALGREVWQSIEAWVYQTIPNAGQPHVTSPGDQDMAWANDKHKGLHLQPAERT